VVVVTGRGADGSGAAVVGALGIEVVGRSGPAGGAGV